MEFGIFLNQVKSKKRLKFSREMLRVVDRSWIWERDFGGCDFVKF